MNTSNEKGKALETAVSAIERCILESDPEFKNRNFSIETNKIVIVEDVKHEIDIYVTVGGPSGYDSIFIFECKNWKKSVGKNEVIILAEKIDALSAQRGFLVGITFSKYAKAKAANNSRVELVCVSESDPGPFPFNMHFFQVIDKAVSLDINSPKLNKIGLKENNFKDATASLDGLPLNFESYIQKEADKFIEQEVNRIDSAGNPDGEYTHQVEFVLDFKKHVFLLNNEPVDSITMQATIKYQIENPVIGYDFDVETRGRCLVMKPVSFGNNGEYPIGMTIVDPTSIRSAP